MKLVTPIFCIILLILPFFSGNAFALQFIPYTGTIQPMTPIVCVLDNSAGSDSLKSVQTALNDWSFKLDYLTHSRNWDMKVQLTDRMKMTGCNIIFNFSLIPSDPQSFKNTISGKPDLARIMGTTSCNNTLYGHVYCQIDIFLLNNTPSNILTTIEHELGHAFGIGHRQGDTPNDAMKAFLSDDLMFPSAKKFEKLTNEDALAIIHMYGVHGFKNVNPPHEPYIIDYPTHLKIKCSHANGTSICITHF